MRGQSIISCAMVAFATSTYAAPLAPSNEMVDGGNQRGQGHIKGNASCTGTDGARPTGAVPSMPAGIPHGSRHGQVSPSASGPALDARSISVLVTTPGTPAPTDAPAVPDTPAMPSGKEVNTPGTPSPTAAPAVSPSPTKPSGMEDHSSKKKTYTDKKHETEEPHSHRKTCTGKKHHTKSGDAEHKTAESKAPETTGSSVEPSAKAVKPTPNEKNSSFSVSTLKADPTALPVNPNGSALPKPTASMTHGIPAGNGTAKSPSKVPAHGEKSTDLPIGSALPSGKPSNIPEASGKGSIIRISQSGKPTGPSQTGPRQTGPSPVGGKATPSHSGSATAKPTSE